MTTRTARRGASARFLALLASCTLITAGIAGVASTAASAEELGTQEVITLPTTQEECEAQANLKWIGGDGPNGQCVDKNSPGNSDDHKVTICHRHASIQNPYNIETVDKDSVADGYKGKFLDGHGEWNHQGPVFDPAVNTKSGGSQDDPGSQWGDIIPPFTADDGTAYPGYNWPAGESILKNGCKIPGYVPATRTVYWCDGEGTQVSNDGFKTWEWAEESDTPGEGVEWFTDEEDVTCDTTTQRTVYWCDGQGTQVSDDGFKTWEWAEESDTPGEGVEWFTDEEDVTCDTTTQRTVYWCDGQGTQVSEDGFETWAWAEGSATSSSWVTNKATLSCGTTVIPPSNPEPPVTTVAVAEAQVAAAPAAAQVAAAPAPATVSVPAAAKLPAAVPAGDGSQAPGLPLWAVALTLLGLLGAGFSAKGLAANRR